MMAMGAEGVLLDHLNQRAADSLDRRSGNIVVFAVEIRLELLVAVPPQPVCEADQRLNRGAAGQPAVLVREEKTVAGDRDHLIVAADEIELMNGIGAVRPDQRAERFLQPQFQPGDAEELFGGGVQWITVYAQ